jgi:sugar lactone lactonase YvrE/DNA-binding IclR family transcriptional regulator
MSETAHPASTSATTAPGLGVLEKAMAVLNLVSAARAPMTFTQLQRASALPKATLHRMLGTLVREGLLRHDSYNKTFLLGFRLLELAHEVWSDFDLRVAAQDELVRLRNAFDESVQLVVLSGQQMVVVASEDAGREPQVASKVGMRLPLHASAAGKAIAACLAPAQQAQLLAASLLERFTEHTIVDNEALRAELDLTRARGYALEVGEYDAERVSVAAPVFDYEGRAIGAVAVTASAAQLDARRAHSLSAELIGAARTITHSAAGQPMSLLAHTEPPAAPTPEVHAIGEARALLGEGPVWSPRDNALYWVDILAPAIHQLDAASGVPRETPLGAMVSMVVPMASGGLLLATPSGLMAMAPDSGRMTLFAHPESARPGNRYNDGKCDRRGRLWVSSMDMGAMANRGNLFRVDPDGSWEKVDSGFTVPNGLGFSPDNTRMYFTDTFRKTIYEYDFDLAAGRIANRRPLVVFGAGEGKPDGLTVDAEGCLWVAVWDGWELARFGPDGRELMRVRLPVPRPTSCCFGGADLGTLYVTSASVRLGSQALASAPLSGALFALEVPGVRGLPETTFAG